MVKSDKKYNKIISKRKRRSVKRKLLLVLKFFLIIIVFAGLVSGFNYFYNSNYFKINSIIVTGSYRYNEEEIKSHADVAIGVNIFEIDKKKVEDRLISELAWIKSISLRKIFPDEIEITVVERKPHVKAYYGGRHFIIDEDGIVLDEVSLKDFNKYDNLILVKNALKYSPAVGEKIAKKNIISCGIIYRTLDLELKKNIKEAYIMDNFLNDIVFTTKNDKRIIFGTSDKITNKNALLSQIIKKLAEENVSYSVIDLRDIDNPLVK